MLQGRRKAISRFTRKFVLALYLTFFSLDVGQAAKWGADIVLILPHYQALKEHFPDEYASLSTWLKEAKKDGLSTLEVMQLAGEKYNEIKSRLVSCLPFASDESRKRIIISYASFLESIYDRQGNEKCVMFMNGGGDANLEDARLYGMQISQFTAVVIEAFASGRDSVIRVDPANESDWKPILEYMRNDDVLAVYLPIIASQDTEVEQYCEAMIAFYETAAELPGEEARRVRSNLASDFVGFK